MDKIPDKIDYVVLEGITARLERTIKRLWILCIIIFLCLVITNAGWIYYEAQWQDETITQEITQDSGDGGINRLVSDIVGGDYYGETDG